MRRSAWPRFRFGSTIGPSMSSFRSFTSDVGVDVISFGGTKNGMMYGEAVVYLDAALARSARYLRKQVTQLPYITQILKEALRLWPPAPAYGISPLAAQMPNGCLRDHSASHAPGTSTRPLTNQPHNDLPRLSMISRRLPASMPSSQSGSSG